VKLIVLHDVYSVDICELLTYSGTCDFVALNQNTYDAGLNRACPNLRKETIENHYNRMSDGISTVVLHDINS
jgi:hypothetical protein